MTQKNILEKIFKIPIGYSIKNNELILIDILTSSNFGTYVAGSSGGGKSTNFAINIISPPLIVAKQKRDLELVIVNTKMVDLKDFEHCKTYSSLSTRRRWNRRTYVRTD